MDKILSKKKYIALFVGPAFLMYLLFGLIPILYNLYLSLFKTNLLGIPLCGAEKLYSPVSGPVLPAGGSQ